ncbi:hypothetical protein HDV05_000660 [Chytridiales sp. JEL 0842]|nr:hypothetical protein HDV05_000660 [Chytridiales sp. JEL 0842]
MLAASTTSSTYTPSDLAQWAKDMGFNAHHMSAAPLVSAVPDQAISDASLESVTHHSDVRGSIILSELKQTIEERISHRKNLVETRDELHTKVMQARKKLKDYDNKYNDAAKDLLETEDHIALVKKRVVEKRRRAAILEAYEKAVGNFTNTIKEYSTLISGLLEIGTVSKDTIKDEALGQVIIQLCGRIEKTLHNVMSPEESFSETESIVNMVQESLAQSTASKVILILINETKKVTDDMRSKKKMMLKMHHNELDMDDLTGWSKLFKPEDRVTAALHTATRRHVERYEEIQQLTKQTDRLKLELQQILDTMNERYASLDISSDSDSNFSTIIARAELEALKATHHSLQHYIETMEMECRERNAEKQALQERYEQMTSFEEDLNKKAERIRIIIEANTQLRSNLKSARSRNQEFAEERIAGHEPKLAETHAELLGSTTREVELFSEMDVSKRAILSSLAKNSFDIVHNKFDPILTEIRDAVNMPKYKAFDKMVSFIEDLKSQINSLETMSKELEQDSYERAMKVQNGSRCIPSEGTSMLLINRIASQQDRIKEENEKVEQIYETMKGDITGDVKRAFETANSIAGITLERGSKRASTTHNSAERKTLLAAMTEIRRRRIVPDPPRTPSPARVAVSDSEPLLEDDKASSLKPNKELRDDLIVQGYKRHQKASLYWSSTLILVTFLAFVTRFYGIHKPAQVVFDEVHFGKFASYYLRGEYYFDVHPPFGKLLLAFTGWFAGYDGHYLFNKIGEDYVTNRVPYIALRLFPATCGALIVPVSFLVLKELGVSLPGALLGSCLILFDNALIAQSRLILLDGMLLLFGVLSAYTWIKFYKLRYSPFSAKWWFWLTSCGVSLAFVTGVKLVGLLMVTTVGIAVIIDLWKILDYKRKLTNWQFIQHFLARCLCLIILPISLYLSFFYVHFALLYKSGPGDGFMSPGFQSELIGSDIALNSIAVPYYSEVTFKHKDTGAFLHSHKDKYPLKYEDGRVSSQGQQVTGYPHKDKNNQWEIIPVNETLYPQAEVYTALSTDESELRYVRSNDIVQLRHTLTNSFLLTHDVASPLTKTNMEVTTILATSNQTNRYNDTLWRVVVTDAVKGDKVKSRRSHLKLVSVPHRVALHTLKTGKLPDWGFGQQEINGNKKIVEKSTVWYIEEVNHEKIVNGTEADADSTSAKEKEKKMPFLKKFMELQAAMIRHNSALTKPHPYSSTPITWPFVLRGISFWEVKAELKQIYLLGNPIAWWFSITGTFLYVAFFLLDRIVARRGVDELGMSIRRWWDRSVGFFFLAWILHWAPFFLMGRMLFLHHYLPSYIYSAIIATLVVEFVGRIFFEKPIVLARGDKKLAAILPMQAWMMKQRLAED